MSPLVYALVDDLFFLSKLDVAAKGLGVELVCLPTPGELIDSVRQRKPDLVILDLGAEHLRPLEALELLAGDDSLRSISTVGYCSHVDVQTMQAAEERGCGRVLPKSAFTEYLAAILTNQPF